MTRRANPSDPTAERTQGQSTQTAGGLGGGRAPTDRARDVHEGEDEVIPRNGENPRTTPRRFDAEENEPALPADDATLKTKI
jgi:hypothetical protein